MNLAYRETYDLPKGYSCEFVLDSGRVECIWSPRMPNGRRWRQLLPHYRAARDNFLAGLAAMAVVVEL